MEDLLLLLPLLQGVAKIGEMWRIKEYVNIALL